MVTIYNTSLSATSQRHFSDGLGGGAGYDSPKIKAVDFIVEAGSTVSGSGSVETWTEDSMIDAEW